MASNTILTRANYANQTTVQAIGIGSQIKEVKMISLYLYLPHPAGDEGFELKIPRWGFALQNGGSSHVTD